MQPGPRTLTRNALTVALAAVATLVIRIPTPATQGYINLGDAVILATALLFGSRAGAISGGIGSALADLLGGYGHWAPFTLIIKGLEGLFAGMLSRNVRPAGRGLILCGVAALLSVSWMVGGYFLVETLPLRLAAGPCGPHRQHNPGNRQPHRRSSYCRRPFQSRPGRKTIRINRLTPQPCPAHRGLSALSA